MTATARVAPESTAQPHRLPPELRTAILEIARSERALDDVLSHSQRLHQARIEHDARSCLVCFGS